MSMLLAEQARQRARNRGSLSFMPSINFDIFRRNDQNTEDLSTEVEDDIDKLLKEEFNKEPLKYGDNEGIKPEDLRAIKLDITFDQKGKEYLDVLLRCSVQHVLQRNEDGSDQDRMTYIYTKLTEDPMGLKQPDYQDPFLFTTNTAYDSDDPDTPKYIPNELQRKLKLYHELMYCYM